MRSKIALITHFNYSDRGPIHGPADSIVSYFKKRKIAYTLIAYPLYTGRKSFSEDFDGITVKRRDFGFEPSFNLFFKSLFEVLRTVISGVSGKYELLIAVDPLNALSALIVRTFGRCGKVIYYTVDYAQNRFANRLHNSIYHKIDAFAVKNSDFVWSVSKRILEKRREQGVANEKNLYVPNTPSLSIAEHLPLDKVDRFKVMMVVGKTHSPILTKVLDAFSGVKRQFPKVKLVLIGPQETNDLDKKIKILGLENNVQILGQVEHEELLDILTRGGIGLALYTQDFPWTYYGDSMKAREYLACGLPVVISDIVSTAEDIKENKAGIVVKPRTADIERAIKKLLGDKKLWEETRKNAINTARKFDFDRILKGVLNKV